LFCADALVRASRSLRLRSPSSLTRQTGSPIAVAVGRGFEGLEERISAAESRICSRLAEVEDKVETGRALIADMIGDVRQEIRQSIADEE
jgi:hypothetical protein